MVAVDPVRAGGPIPTRTADALIDIDAAVNACEPNGATAGVTVHCVFTGSAILARTAGAFIDINLTLLTFKSGDTGAVEAVHHVDA